ncbi:MAG: FIST C-terminal domain-containing protein [Phycisphaerales bacterium]|nr:FIST C-terminal domain-containing protein [Phycisphaerales bacterium]
MAIPTTGQIAACAAGVGAHADATEAATIAAGACRARLGDSADVAMVFFSKALADGAGEIASVVHEILGPKAVVGVSGDGVVEGSREYEDAPAVSIWAARMPGVEFSTFDDEDLGLGIPRDPGDPLEFEAIGAENLRATFVFADPRSVPTIRVVPALNRAIRRPDAWPVLLGGLASGGTDDNPSALIRGRTSKRRGLVGLNIHGSVCVETVVSQGCRPIGPNFVITKAKNNVILELGGKPAAAALHEVIQQLNERERSLISRGLFIGRVVNEYKDRFGRADYLIRAVVGVDRTMSAIGVGDLIRVGQTVRFHLRDAATAHEDLAMLLDSQQLRDPPVGAILITCNKRGCSLFGGPHHDATMVSRAFQTLPAGEDLAKAGRSISPTGAASDELPMAGFFAAGEFGPAGSESYVHGHTACVTMFRMM